MYGRRHKERSNHRCELCACCDGSTTTLVPKPSSGRGGSQCNCDGAVQGEGAVKGELHRGVEACLVQRNS